jgi:hypothetical protein
MKIAGRLYAGKHSFLEWHAETSPIALPDGTTGGAGASLARGRHRGSLSRRGAAPVAHDCLEAFDRYIARAFA